MSTIADLRREYASRALGEDQAAADPIRQFAAWFEEAANAQILDVNAMTLATVAADGRPAARSNARVKRAPTSSCGGRAQAAPKQPCAPPAG